MKKILRQFLQFIGISGAGWILDMAVYFFLCFLSRNLAVNNLCSSCLGATFVFIFSTRYVFRTHTRLPLRWKYGLYLLYQLILLSCVSHLLVQVYGAVQGVLAAVQLGALAPLIAKIAVTPVTMTVNFIIMKGLLEKL